MKSIFRTVAVSSLTFLLTHCGGGQPADVPADESQILSARNGVIWTLRIGDLMGMNILRPGALLGTYVTYHLVHNSVFRSAVEGIQAQLYFLFDENFEQTESFALLEELGTILQVNVPDMLNRSTNRPRAFDTYVQSLQEMQQRSQIHVTRLKQERDDVQDERRLARRASATIQRDLNSALRNQDYSAASGLQQRLITAEGDLAELEAQEDEKNDLIRLFEDLMEVGEERLAAMQANRQALLVGVMVTELPGVDDLGLIKQSGRRSRSTNNSILLDPIAN